MNPKVPIVVVYVPPKPQQFSKRPLSYKAQDIAKAAADPILDDRAEEFWKMILRLISRSGPPFTS